VESPKEAWPNTPITMMIILIFCFLFNSLLQQLVRLRSLKLCQAFGGLETQVVPWTNQKSVGYYQASW
jgi:hypothetical protein